jgi:hypothetical protein
MSRTRGVLAGIGIALAGLAGCQTQYGGMTVPTGHYLEHPPSYFPTESPQFPYARELATMQAQAAEAETRAGVGQGLPPRVPVGP